MKNIDKKINEYIDKVFEEVGPSQQLFDLKEELVTNMKEKIVDYTSRGLDEEQAFREAVASLGDLSGLVEDMRKIGQDKAREAVYTNMSNKVSTAGIIIGVLLILFGSFSTGMLHFMNIPKEGAVAPGIFIVGGGIVLTYSLLTIETKRKYAMNKIRAAFYALAVGLILFGIFSAVMSGTATGEVFIAIGSLMVYVLAGVALMLYLLLTGRSRKK